MLLRTQATLLVANNGSEAVELAQQSPDLILMDIQMPEMDGISAAQKIKSKAPDIIIIALTANVLPEDIKDTRTQALTGTSETR